MKHSRCGNQHQAGASPYLDSSKRATDAARCEETQHGKGSGMNKCISDGRNLAIVHLFIPHPFLKVGPSVPLRAVFLLSNEAGGKHSTSPVRNPSPSYASPISE